MDDGRKCEGESAVYWALKSDFELLEKWFLRIENSMGLQSIAEEARQGFKGYFQSRAGVMGKDGLWAEGVSVPGVWPSDKA